MRVPCSPPDPQCAVAIFVFGTFEQPAASRIPHVPPEVPFDSAQFLVSRVEAVPVAAHAAECCLFCQRSSEQRPGEPSSADALTKHSDLGVVLRVPRLCPNPAAFLGDCHMLEGGMRFEGREFRRGDVELQLETSLSHNAPPEKPLRQRLGATRTGLEEIVDVVRSGALRGGARGRQIGPSPPFGDEARGSTERMTLCDGCGLLTVGCSCLLWVCGIPD